MIYVLYISLYPVYLLYIYIPCIKIYPISCIYLYILRLVKMFAFTTKHTLCKFRDYKTPKNIFKNVRNFYNLKIILHFGLNKRDCRRSFCYPTFIKGMSDSQRYPLNLPGASTLFCDFLKVLLDVSPL